MKWLPGDPTPGDMVRVPSLCYDELTRRTIKNGRAAANEPRHALRTPR